MEDSKGLLCGGGWLEAKEMWSAGCMSLVATRRAHGRVRRSLITGAMERPSVTAKLPFCTKGQRFSTHGRDEGLENKKKQVERVQRSFLCAWVTPRGLSALWIVGTETHWWAEVFLEVDNDERGFEGFV